MGVKRLMAIAISVAALAGPPCLSAQRGGGGRSFGGGGGFGGARPSGGFSTFRSSPAPVSRPTGSSGFASVRRGSGDGQGWHGGRPGPSGGGPYHGTNHPYHRGYGYGYYPYYGYGYGLYPYGYLPSAMSYAGFPNDYPSEQNGAETPPQDYGSPYGPENEVEGQAYPEPPYPPYPGPAYGPGYGPGGAPAEAQNAAPAAPPEPQIPTVLVYRDGRQVEIQNYAISGQTVWVFGDQITRKIAVADLDVAKTKQLNDKRGVEFDVPESP